MAALTRCLVSGAIDPLLRITRETVFSLTLANRATWASVGVCGIANKRGSSAKRLSSVIGRSPHHLSANITCLNRSRGCALKEMLALRFQLAHLRRSFPMSGQTTVAVIGLGSMGLVMARSMLKAGHRVY